MTRTELVESFGEAVMMAADQWLDANEGKEDESNVVGIVVSVSPDYEDQGIDFAVGSTHNIGDEVIVEILLSVVNKILPTESQMRLVVTPKLEPKGHG